jgi:uncharacterized membrane protein
MDSHLPPTARFDMVPTMDSTDIPNDAAANVPLTSCPHCAAQMPETAVFCPGCGRSMKIEKPARGKVGAFPENIAGTLAYFTFIPAIVFLLVDPYKGNRFVRFHSLQCLLLCGATILAAIALKLASVVLFIVPVLGPLLMVLVSIVVALAAAVIWLVLVVKAFQGVTFRLPVLGDFAAHYATVL